MDHIVYLYFERNNVPNWRCNFLKVTNGEEDAHELSLCVILCIEAYTIGKYPIKSPCEGQHIKKCGVWRFEFSIHLQSNHMNRYYGIRMSIKCKLE